MSTLTNELEILRRYLKDLDDETLPAQTKIPLAEKLIGRIVQVEIARNDVDNKMVIDRESMLEVVNKCMESVIGGVQDYLIEYGPITLDTLGSYRAYLADNINVIISAPFSRDDSWPILCFRCRR